MAFQLREFFAPWLKSSPERRDFFLHHPREAMEEIVGVPDDIDVDVEWIAEQIWFQASIPKLPGDGDRSLVAMRQRNERLNRCPVLRVSGQEFINNHIQILAEHGMRVPEDVVVLIDPGANGYIHFRIRLDVLYSS